TQKNGVHIIDLYKTIEQLNQAIDLVSSTVKKGGSILFVATKKAAKTVVEEEADRCGMFHVTERWLGGTLTNFMTIKKSIKRLHLLEKDETSGVAETLTKKELLMRTRERNRLQTQHRGIKDMRRLPDVVIVVDAKKETIAIAEALRLEIPIVAVVDTNTDPRKVDIPIPANDDSIQAVRLLMGNLADAILEAKGISNVKETEEATA
ncbi:MAG: 30S ribosomal protein S2, partial [Candidatus Marinimicrobia bacterium]|nr:30S ribosomal protein S2 [Candidatus Neomarinimicrobiota bacterium]